MHIWSGDPTMAVPAAVRRHTFFRGCVLAKLFVLVCCILVRQTLCFV